MGQIEMLKLRKKSLWNEIVACKIAIACIVNDTGGDDNADEYRALLVQLEKEYNAL